MKMSKCTNCLVAGVVVHEICDYDADLLGAPFQVILTSGVKEVRCTSCDAKLETIIPDLNGLLRVVARRRALEPRRLKGAEIRFLRNAMGWKSKQLAQRLGLTAEHLSRCENGAKQFSTTVEKWFRLFVVYKLLSKVTKEELNIDELFDMQFEAVWDPRRPLVLCFHHVDDDKEERDEGEQSDGNWQLQKPMAVAYAS
jgi:DNA-binding transcriptional regulator YiaG